MGYNRLEADDLIGRIEIGPVDRLGNLLVKVEVADSDYRWRKVRAEFGTHYPDLERFLTQLTRMLRADTETAVLLGE